MIILKLGGSVITDKAKYLSFRQKATESIVKVITKLPGKKMIVHGGGSFGHLKAKEFGIPGKLSAARRVGYSVIHRDMVDLNSRVVDLFISNGIDAVSVEPSSVFVGRRKFYDSVDQMFRSGLVPVLFGDVYFSSSSMIGIYSGDRIVYDLSVRYKPNIAVFFTDVDGIYDVDPKINPEARLLKTIEYSPNFSSIENDVTGGMKGKYDIMRKIKRHVPAVYLVNGNYPERLLDRNMDTFIGTVIK
ncbi:MAG: isopentenyl phosphate kinase [Thermoplasmataceae archaeon]|jgi:isopentenyl phosphate kinase